MPIRFGLTGVLAGGVLLPLADASWQLAVLVVGIAALAGLVWTPAMALLADGADGVGVPQGLAFGLVNPAWAGGQTLGATGGSATADAASDAVAYGVVGLLCAATLLVIARLMSGERHMARVRRA